MYLDFVVIYDEIQKNEHTNLKNKTCWIKTPPILLIGRLRADRLKLTLSQKTKKK